MLLLTIHDLCVHLNVQPPNMHGKIPHRKEFDRSSTNELSQQKKLLRKARHSIGILTTVLSLSFPSLSPVCCCVQKMGCESLPPACVVRWCVACSIFRVPLLIERISRILLILFWQKRNYSVAKALNLAFPKRTIILGCC